MVLYIIGAPLNKGNRDQTFNSIKVNVFRAGAFSRNAGGYVFDPQVSKFKLGNLDSLIYLNEQLIKQEAAVEGLLKKLERQALDIVQDEKLFDKKIESDQGYVTTLKYVENFKWEDRKYSTQHQLPDILNQIKERTELIERDLRKKVQEWQETKNSYNQLSRREGNLYSRDLQDVLTNKYVDENDFPVSQYVQSLVAVVPQAQIEEFLASYESISEYVIPRSAKQFKVSDKDDLTLWRITVFKQDFNEIGGNKRRAQAEADQDPAAGQGEAQEKAHKLRRTPVEQLIVDARDKFKIALREFEFRRDSTEQRDKERAELQVRTQQKETLLLEQCKKGFMEVYVAYIHLKRLRFIVDVAMRFGAKEDLCCCVIVPEVGKEKKVTEDLLNLFADPSQKGLYGTKEELEDQEDFFPYSYVPINIH